MDRFPSLRNSEYHNNHNNNRFQLTSFAPTAITKNGSTTSYEPLTDTGYRWEPGLSKAPFLGLAGLVVCFCGILVAILILVTSNSSPVDSWRFAPTVYLAIASTITNITLAFCLLEGVAIAWWKKALENGTNLRDLHHIYAFGTSFKAAIFAGKHINPVAVACLLVAFAPINGPLLQRASSFGPGKATSSTVIDVHVAKLIPQGSTGFMTNRGYQVNTIRSNFSTIAADYFNSKPIPISTTCQGICTTTIQAAGFHASCSTYTQPYDATQRLDTDFPEILSTYVWSDPGRAPVTLNVSSCYMPKQPSCIGDMIIQNCSLNAGTVEYPVVIDGTSKTISLTNKTSIWDDVVVGDPDSLNGEVLSAHNSTYGGIFLTVANKWTAKLQYGWGGPIGYELVGQASASTYSYLQDIDGFQECQIYSLDPMPDFLQDVRALMLRSAVGLAATNDTQTVTAQQVFSNVLVYHTNYLFLTLATAASTIALIAVAITFHGFWILGRECTLSPVETAKAFNAPLLKGSDSNAPLDSLLTVVGRRPVKYGVVMDTPGQAYTSSAYTAHTTRSRGVQDIELDQFGMPVDEANNVHLELADPSRVSDIRPGDSFKIR